MVTSNHWSSLSSVKFSHSRPMSQLICARHAQSSPNLAYISSLSPDRLQLVFRPRSVCSRRRRRLEDFFATPLFVLLVRLPLVASRVVFCSPHWIFTLIACVFCLGHHTSSFDKIFISSSLASSSVLVFTCSSHGPH